MPEFTDKDKRTIDSLVSMANTLADELSSSRALITTQKRRIEELLKRIDYLESRTIEAGDGIEIEKLGSSTTISAEGTPLNDTFPKHIVIRGTPVEIPTGTKRYIHANIRSKSLTLSDSAEAQSSEVEVYDKQDIFAPHLTGF